MTDDRLTVLVFRLDFVRIRSSRSTAGLLPRAIREYSAWLGHEATAKELNLDSLVEFYDERAEECGLDVAGPWINALVALGAALEGAGYIAVPPPSDPCDDCDCWEDE